MHRLWTVQTYLTETFTFVGQSHYLNSLHISHTNIMPFSLQWRSQWGRRAHQGLVPLQNVPTVLKRWKIRVCHLELSKYPLSYYRHFSDPSHHTVAPPLHSA